MKTLPQLTAIKAKNEIRIKDILKERSPDSKTLKEYGRLTKENKFIKMCMDYLKTEPTAQFIKSEQDRLSNRVNKIMEGWTKTLDEDFAGQKKPYAKAKKDYEKLMDLPKTRTQLKTINFLS